MVAHRRYRQIGDDVSAETALAQAAQIFDLAAVFAVEARDVENLLRIGMAWTDFSNLLGNPGGEEDEEEKEEDDEEPRVLGFTGKRIENGGTESSTGPISAGSHSRNR